jgi:hypothetical protein
MMGDAPLKIERNSDVKKLAGFGEIGRIEKRVKYQPRDLKSNILKHLETS